MIARYIASLLILGGTLDAWEPSKIPRRHSSQPTRRDWLQAAASLSGGLASATALFPNPALAKDEIFRTNPLTNPLLEQVRIWDQAQANELKYGGELERGDAGNKGKVDAYPSLLVPILDISNSLDRIDQLVSLKKEEESSSANKIEAWKKARQILTQPEFEKTAFKKIFNRYGDNIYYSDPDRANAYLGGGATPKSEQSLAYLLRNEILTNVEDLQAELDFLIKTPEESTEDLRNMIQTARNAMKSYLGVVPPGELEKARRLLAESG